MNELYGLSYSPWTEKARWALLHHRILFRYVEHAPMRDEQQRFFGMRGYERLDRGMDAIDETRQRLAASEIEMQIARTKTLCRGSIPRQHVLKGHPLHGAVVAFAQARGGANLQAGDVSQCLRGLQCPQQIATVERRETMCRDAA